MNTLVLFFFISTVPYFSLSLHHHRQKHFRTRHGSGYSWGYGTSGTGYGYGSSTWSYDDAEKCPSVSLEECTCVPRENCNRGVLVNDAPSVIVRRGKRTVINGMLDALGYTFGHAYPGYGYGVDWNVHGNRGTIDLGGLISSFIPRVDVRVRKPGSAGCGDDCGRGTSVDVNVGGGGRRRCPGDGCNVSNPRPLPPPPSEPCTDGNGCSSEKDISIDIPFTGIRVQVRKNGERLNPSNSGSCPTCGGSSSSRPKPKPTNARPRTCPAGQVCCKSRSTSEAKPIPPRDDSCGLRAACGVDQRTGKSTRKGDCEFGEYPWLAMILKKDPASGKKEFLCNGALIDKRRIVTVAQCLEDLQDSAENIEVRLGEWDVSAEVESYAQRDYPIQSVKINPNYQNDTLINDIALVTLEDVVVNDVHISPVCVPRESETFNYRSCVVTGWGNRDPIAKESYVECLDEEECQERLRRTRLGPNYNLDEGFMCASSRIGACLIDGGGPLVCKRKDNSYALVGLISWSVDVNSPEVYVRVQNYLQWLDENSNQQESQPSAPEPAPSSPQPLPPSTTSPPRVTYPDEETPSSSQDSNESNETFENPKKESEYAVASASGPGSSYAWASASAGPSGSSRDAHIGWD